MAASKKMAWPSTEDKNGHKTPRAPLRVEKQVQFILQKLLQLFPGEKRDRTSQQTPLIWA